MTSPDRPLRLTLILRKDLSARVHAVASMIRQNPNHFVNKCVEGCLDAMESEEIAFDIPLVTLFRKISGVSLLDAKWIPAICSLFMAEAIHLTPRHLQILAGLLNDHQGDLAEDVIRFYPQ